LSLLQPSPGAIQLLFNGHSDPGTAIIHAWGRTVLKRRVVTYTCAKYRSKSVSSQQQRNSQRNSGAAALDHFFFLHRLTALQD
jgi:hypothetical protein